jgi:hypothetical protein
MNITDEKIPIVVWNVETKKIVAVSQSMHTACRFVTGATGVNNISLVRYALKHTGVIAKNKNILGCVIKLKIASKEQTDLLKGKKIVIFD